MKGFKRIFFLLVAITAVTAICGILPDEKPAMPWMDVRINPGSKIKTDNYTKFSASEVVAVKILSYVKIREIVFAPEAGSYAVVADGRNLITLDAQNALKIAIAGDSLELKSFEKNWGKFSSVKLISPDEQRSFKVKSLNPERKPRYFSDNLSVSIENNLLKLVNESVLDNYIAGVAEAEAGPGSHNEFYKVQAILARTYALAHITKHQAEGFNLCDQVHCQAFLGKTQHDEILQAVSETKGKVVVDEDMNLIVAVFHSNSGGQTVNSEDVWGKPTSYLRSVNDSFSLKMPNARWTRKIATSDWLDYLKIKHNFPIEDSAAKYFALHFRQDARKINLEYGNIKVPLKNVRTDFQLKSTYFSLEPIGDTLIFNGRGFGHGIGMCQEGAMRMARAGYNYKDVLNFYYKNVHIIDLKDLNFFRE